MKLSPYRRDISLNLKLNFLEVLVTPWILAPKWASLTKANPQIMGYYQN